MVSAKSVWGQTPPAAPSAPAEDDDAALVPAEPDFALINLPTTLRLPRHKGNFRLTHRFQGNLRGESFGNQASNLFGLDNGAAIGFEFRYAVARHLQAAVYRTNVDRQTQFYAKYDPIAQSASMPVSISALASVEGSNNFRRDRAPAFGVIVSRRVGDLAAVYATPVWAHNSAVGSGTDRETAFVGLGGRLHLRPGLYAVAEVSPRLAGYTAGEPAFGFAIEGRAGGHVFQLNFSNSTGTTLLQTARGGFVDKLFLGFNIARKFY
jgi:hypothetical protein